MYTQSTLDFDLLSASLAFCFHELGATSAFLSTKLLLIHIAFVATSFSSHTHSILFSFHCRSDIVLSVSRWFCLSLMFCCMSFLSCSIFWALVYGVTVLVSLKNHVFCTDTFGCLYAQYMSCSRCNAKQELSSQRC